MHTVSHIQAFLHNLTGQGSDGSSFPELMLFELMCAGEEAGTLTERFSTRLRHLPEEHLPRLAAWQRVCLSWVLHHPALSFADADLIGRLGQLDEAIVRAGRDALQLSTTGLLDGSALYLNYLLERASRQPVEPVPALLAEAVRLAFGNQLTPLLDARYAGPVDLTMQPGLIGLLLTLLRAADDRALTDPQREQLLALVRFVVRFTQAVDLPDSQYSFFPNRVDLRTQEHEVSNALSWAEGDLGVALLLYRAARYFGEPAVRKLADCVGTFSLLRDDVESTLIEKPWFLNGAAGTAMLYGALGQASGNVRYGQAQARWLRHVSRMLAEPSLTAPQVPASFLTGYPGILLCLRTAEGSCRDDWKRLSGC